MIDGPRYYARDGSEITLEQWCALLGTDPETRAYRKVVTTEVGSYLISTVWLGLDHNFGLGDVPLIFETMVFASVEGDPLGLDLDCRRYATEAQAVIGHAETVTLVRATTVEVPTGDPANDAERPTEGR